MIQEINNLCYSMLSSCGVSISVCETVWKQILLPHFWVASTASVMPMNKGMWRGGGSVEAICTNIICANIFFCPWWELKKMRIKAFKPFILIVVAEIRLERMTFGLWAQRATNCSTPRCLTGAKVRLFLKQTNNLLNIFRVNHHFFLI